MPMVDTVLSITSSLLLFALSLYFAAKKKGASRIGMSGMLMLLSLIEFVDSYSLFYSSSPLAFKNISTFMESLLPLTCVSFTLVYGRQEAARSASLLWRLVTAASVMFPACVLFVPFASFYYSPDFQSEKILFLGTEGYWFYVGLMMYCIAALANLEATFSTTTGKDTWRIKFEVIGIGSILSVLIFYYSQGLLYRVINMNLTPIRSGIFIVAALLIGYSNFFRGNGVRVVVSRHIMYRSVTALVVGLYLMSLGLIGHGMRYFGISFGDIVTPLLYFLFGIALTVLLFSERVRRRVKVYVSKNFFASKHDYREEWLKFTRRLSSCRSRENVYAAILATFMDTFMLDGDALYAARNGGEKFEIVETNSMSSLPSEFCVSRDLLDYFLGRERVLVPGDGEYSPTVEEAEFISRTGARLIVPLVCNDAVEGLVLFRRQVVKDVFIYEDYDLMRTLARQAALALANFRLSEELLEAGEMAAVSKVSSFVVHDIKNLTYSFSLALENAEQFIDDPQFQRDLLDTMKKAVTKMKDLVQRLKAVPDGKVSKPMITDVSTVVRQVVEEAVSTRPGANIVFAGSPAFSAVDGEEIRRVIVNLLINALDAVGDRGTITIETGVKGKEVCIKVADDGCGATEDFIRHHMFRPFRTTKEKGIGIGLYQCKQIVAAYGGGIRAEAGVEKGMIFTVSLPQARAEGYAIHA